MKEITFKIKENNLHILVDKDLSNKEFLDLLKERLEKLLVVKDSLKKNVTLNIEDRYLNNREILMLFDILNDANLFCLSKIICKNKSKQNLMIYKGNIRGGQVRFFDKSLLIVGNIHSGSKIIVNGDLYILGNVNGNIEIKDNKGHIFVEHMYNSVVKIAEVYKVFSDDIFSKELFLEGKEIVEKDYKKGEMIYGKSNSCYIR